MANKKVELSVKQQEIWDHIKGMKAEYYALPNITVEGICEPVNLDPSCLYLTLKGPAALTSIEAVLNGDTVKNWDGKQVPRYIIESRDRFAVILDNLVVKAP